MTHIHEPTAPRVAAIPTVYRGCRFRSRLEARWSVFFDLLGWRSQYEPFDLGKWSPDFLLTGIQETGVLAEVKPITQFDPKIGNKIWHSALERERRDALLVLPIAPWRDKTTGDLCLGWGTYGACQEDPFDEEETFGLARFKVFADESPAYDFTMNDMWAKGELTGFDSHYSPETNKHFPDSFSGYRCDLLDHRTMREFYIGQIMEMWGRATSTVQWLGNAETRP